MATENIKAQQSLLATIREQNARTLSETGIAGRALLAAGIDDPSNLKPAISRVATAGQDSTPSTQYMIAFEPIKKTGTAADTMRYANVAEEVGGLLMPNPGFDDHDASKVHSMVEALELERQYGELPGLSYNLLGIFDPSTAMTLRKPD